MESIKERAKAVKECDRTKIGCPICGGYTPLIWNQEMGWMVKCDICNNIFASKERITDRAQALNYHVNKFQETRKLLKEVRRLKDGNSKNAGREDHSEDS